MAPEKGKGLGRGVDGMTAPTLRGQRLTLRQLERDDASALFEILSDREVMRFWSSGPHTDVDETRRYIAWNADCDAEHICWAITHDGTTALGWVILIPRRTRNYEIGYILGRSYWGQGYVYEAASLALDFAFSNLSARRISADTDPENNASIRVLQKLGFQREGFLREEWETHIGIRDSAIFGLLRREWQNLRA
jgi:[ribosomal protein S5]-alanine N-acetyltransferase